MLLRLALRLLGEEIQVDENPDFRPQYLRHDGGGDVIDGAERIALRHVMIVVEVGGNEDDGYVRRPAPFADQGRGLEAVHPRHVDVEQDDREVALEHLLQRLLARCGGEQILAEVLEDRPVDQQLVGPIVDDQDIGAVGLRLPLSIVVHRVGVDRHRG